MKHSALSLRLFLGLLTLMASCAVPSVDVMPRYGQSNLEGHFGVRDGGSGTVSVTDLSKAGFGDDDGYLSGRVDIDFGSPMLSISTQQTSHTGRGITTTALSASGGAVPANAMVDTDMDFGLHQVNLTFDFVPTDLIDAGIGFGVAVVDVDARLTEVSTTNSVQTDEVLPIPELVAHVGLDLGDFEVRALASGFQISTGGDDLSFLDVDIMARHHLFGFSERLSGSIALGYRSTKLSIDYEDDGDQIDVAFRFNGPYLAFVFSL